MSNESERIDTSKYDEHTITYWCARNVGDGGESCDNDYDHDEPFIETDDGKGENPAIGYFDGGRTAHPLEEKRANIRLMADAPEILAELKRCYEREDELVEMLSILLQTLGLLEDRHDIDMSDFDASK